MVLSPYDLSVPGGVQGQVIAMALELSRRGRTVLVASPGQGSDQELSAAGVAEVRIGRVRRFPANGSVAPLSLSFSASAAIRRRAVAQGLVVHLHEPVTPVFGWSCFGAHELAKVATFHRAGLDWLYRAAGPSLAPRARRLDAAVAVSPAAAATVKATLKIDCEVLFNGLDLAPLATATPWETTGPTVLFIGRDEPRKGRAVLLEAALLLDSAVTLWCTGVAPHGWVQGGGARVEWLGVISEEEKRRRLVAADVLCAPSLGGESFGIVLLEGLAAGCSVVASDIDGYRQALDGHGLLTPPRDPVQLAATITAALSGAGPDRTLGASHAQAWSMSSLMDRYEQLYEAAAARR